MDDFHVYVLDKLEAVLTSNNVVDTLHYADTLEIEAFLRHFDLTMLRVRPANELTRGVQDLGAVHGFLENEVMGTVSDEAHLRSLLQHENIDLQLMHYQNRGLEHFDIVHLVKTSFGIAPDKKAKIFNALRDSRLHCALSSGSASTFRRCALHLLGIAGADDDAEDSSSDVSDSDSSSSDPEGQNMSSSSSDENSDDSRETYADAPVPSPPPAEGIDAQRRGKGKIKLGSGFQSGCGGIHSAASKAPPAAVSTSKDAEAEDVEKSSDCLLYTSPSPRD